MTFKSNIILDINATSLFYIKTFLIVKFDNLMVDFLWGINIFWEENLNIPLYSIALPSLKNLIVGYPRIPCCSAKSVSAVASTLASNISDFSSFRAVAALAYSGSRALQWPHHGASNNQIKYFNYQ